MATKLSRGLYCGVALSALLIPGVAHAGNFTITNGTTVTTTQTLTTTGDVGKVDLGGTINVPAGKGIVASVDGVTVDNAGSVTAGGGNMAINVKGNSRVTNSGTVTGTFGIYGFGDTNTINNSGLVTGGSFGIYAQGNGNIVTNSGTVTDNFGIYAQGNSNTVINSGTVSGGNFGIYAQGNGNTVTNSGTVTDVFGIYAQGNTNSVTNTGTVNGGSYGIYAQGNNNTISNSGLAGGAVAAVTLQGTGNTLNLLAGSNLQGNLDLGTGNFLNIGPGLNTAFAYTGTLNLGTFGAPYVVNGSTLYVIDPTGFAAQNAMLNDLTRVITDTVDERLAMARTEGSPVAMAMNGMTVMPTADLPAGPNSVIWAAGLGNYRSQKSKGPDASFDTLLGGITLGLDGEVANGTRAGGFVGAGFSNFKTDGGSQKISTDSLFGGLYGGFNGSGHFIDLSLTGGYSAQSSDRTVANNQVPGGLQHATANYGGFFISPSATLGTDVHMESGIFTPSVRARYAGMFLSGYDETGSAANLSVGSHTVNVFDLRGQLAFAPTPKIMDSGTFGTLLRLGADGTFSSGNNIDAVLLGQALSFNAGNTDATVRGFVGFDMTYAANSGSKFFLGAEAGYDTNNAFTGEAKTGFEIPL